MVSTRRRVVFGLGSNLGDRVSYVLAGANALALMTEFRRAELSPLYETAPVGGPPQDDFINAALAVDTELPARMLLSTALRIEQQHGRIRVERYGPRTLDIDVLWIDGQVVDEAGLQVPHPRLCERAFALRPLLDVAPRAKDPRTGELMAVAMSTLSTAGLERLQNRPGEANASISVAHLPIR